MQNPQPNSKVIYQHYNSLLISAFKVSMKKEEDETQYKEAPPSQDEEEKSEYDQETRGQQKNILVDKNDVFNDWKEKEGEKLSQMILESIVKTTKPHFSSFYNFAFLDKAQRK